MCNARESDPQDHTFEGQPPFPPVATCLSLSPPTWTARCPGRLGSKRGCTWRCATPAAGTSTRCARPRDFCRARPAPRRRRRPNSACWMPSPPRTMVTVTANRAKHRARRFRLDRHPPKFEPKAEFFPDARELIHGSVMDKRSHRIFAGVNLLLTKRLYGATIGFAGHPGRRTPTGTRAMRLALSLGPIPAAAKRPSRPRARPSATAIQIPRADTISFTFPPANSLSWTSSRLGGPLVTLRSGAA